MSVSDITWLSPSEFCRHVTVNGRRYEDDLAQLRADREVAYHEYMAAATSGDASPHTVEALRLHWSRFDEAERCITDRARKYVVELATKKYILGFGLFGPDDRQRRLIRPEWWNFLELDYERSRATGRGFDVHGVVFVNVNDAPAGFQATALRLLNAAASPTDHRDSLVTCSKERVREAARAVYRNHNAPNIRDAEKLIRAVLQEDGRRPGKSVLRDVLGEDEFARQRRKPGKPSAA